MRVILLEETVEFANQRDEIDRLMNYITTKLEGTAYHFSHLVVDEEEVYEDVEAYLLERINEIETIEVKVKTVMEFAHDLLLSTKEYIQRASPEVERLAEEFYQTPTEDTWHNLSQFLEGLEWINAMIESIDQSSYTPHNWNDYLIIKANLYNQLQGFEEALQAGDHTLVADIVHYEILPILEELNQTITATFDREGDPQSAN